MKNTISENGKTGVKFPAGMISFVALMALLLAPAVRAGIPEPGARLYGTIAVNGTMVNSNSTSIVVEARKTSTGAPIASYRMGSDTAAGNFYSLKLNGESTAPLVNDSNAALGSTIYLVVRNATSDLDSKTVTLSERGLNARVDFGAVDTDGDGMSDAFELANFGSITGGDPNGDPDHDGRPNLREFLQGTNPKVADGRHPADISPADDRITLKEVTDYILAWKTGGTWPVEPALNSPNIEDYVTRAGAIWKGGEVYIFDNDPETVAPLWWTNPPVSSLLLTKSKPTAESPAVKLSVQRQLAGNYKANQAVPITISVTPTDKTKAYVVVETPPTGWTVRNMSHDARWDDANHKIKWGPFFDQTPRTLTYDAVPGPTSSGAANFAGRGSFDGVGELAAGPSRMWPLGQTPPPSLTFAPIAGDGLTLVLRGEPGRAYQVVSSGDLKTWTDDATSTLNSQGYAMVPVTVTSQVRYFRLRTAE